MSRKIQATKNYSMFTRHEGENRPFDLSKHRRLLDSMKFYGFLQEFPIVCVRDKKGNLVVKDGQHRLAIAQSLGLTVFWVEASKDWDVAVVNSTAKPWVLRDYAEKHAANGLTGYRDGLEFADLHHLPIGVAFALLAGTTNATPIMEAFVNGTFKVKDRDWADQVAATYGPMVGLSAEIRSARFMEACMACCRVDGFDPERLIACAHRCREKLVSFSTRDAYLDMLEEVYNFGRKQLVGLKSAALMAMRERNPANGRKTAKKNPEPAAA